MQVSAGRITAYLRDEWGLNAILADGDEDEKNRADHRHHAVDAAVIALTNAATVELLSRSAELAAERGHRLFVQEEIQKPWPTFLDDLRCAIDAVNISYRVNRRVTGALHKETTYSKPHSDPTAKTARTLNIATSANRCKTCRPTRSKTSWTIRFARLVQAKLEQIGGEPKKVFADPGNHPYLTAGDGRSIFIHKARIRKPVAVIPLGKPASPRYAAPGSNHHMEIFAVLDKEGKEKKWDAKIVSLFEAHRRVVRANPSFNAITARTPSSNSRWRGGNTWKWMTNRGAPALSLSRVISGKSVEFRLHTDARPITVVRRLSGGHGLTSQARQTRCERPKHGRWS